MLYIYAIYMLYFSDIWIRSVIKTKKPMFNTEITLLGNKGQFNSQLVNVCWFLDQRNLLEDPTARNVWWHFLVVSFQNDEKACDRCRFCFLCHCCHRRSDCCLHCCPAGANGQHNSDNNNNNNNNFDRNNRH